MCDLPLFCGLADSTVLTIRRRIMQSIQTLKISIYNFKKNSSVGVRERYNIN